MAAVHDGARPLAWLLGHWESIEAKGIWPGANDFNYKEMLNVTHLGEPFLNFYSEAFLGDVPFHIESGFIRLKPDTSRVAYICAQSIGLVEIEEGELHGTSLKFTEPSVMKMSFGTKATNATALTRTFCLNSKGFLEQIVFMATAKVPLTEHLHITYKKKNNANL